MKKILVIIILIITSITNTYAINNKKINIVTLSNWIIKIVNKYWIDKEVKIKYYEYIIKKLNQEISILKEEKIKKDDSIPPDFSDL